MFYIQQDNKIVLSDEDKQKLQNTIAFMPQYQELEIQEVEEGYTIVDFELITLEEKQKREEEQQKQIRNEEIDNKIKELQIMSIPEILNGNIENIKIYNSVIDGLEKAKL